MSIIYEKINKSTLPCIVLPDDVLFPGQKISLPVKGRAEREACEDAATHRNKIFIISAKDGEKDEYGVNDLARTGVTAYVVTTVREGSMLRIVVSTFCRATLSDVRKGEMHYATVLEKHVIYPDGSDARVEAYRRTLLKTRYNVDDKERKAAGGLALAHMTDIIAQHDIEDNDAKQSYLDEFDPCVRARRLIAFLREESSIRKEQKLLEQRTKERMDKNAHVRFLREQMNEIRHELGMEEFDESAGGDSAELYAKLKKMNLPEEARAKIEHDIRKMDASQYGSAEYSVLQNYLETCLELPWGKKTADCLNINNVKKVLEQDHDGLEKVKERIVEYLSARKLNPELKNQILCLVGPPGVGKTSIASSVARAMNRKYVRVSLGGIRDEAEIRGHRKTYVGSMPGRIMNALINVKVDNPVMLLDEVDKLTNDGHGDPASALLEVLDTEQNKAFRDHFVEIPYDLSDCLFIATANTLETVPRPLIDRMDIIELHAYTVREKISIAENHLIPKQMKLHGITKRMMRFEEGTVEKILSDYTFEAGVRNLEREIATVCRKAAAMFVSGSKTVKVTKDNIAEFLGPKKRIPERISDHDEVGCVNGMAYTEMGGELMQIEAIAVPGTGKIELTGSLGDVMKESAKAAVTYIRAHSGELGIDPDFHKTRDVHIHAPEGAVPKDGPSAGVTMTTALISELSGVPVRRDVSMTGEITLHGKVLAIGGLREKTMAAFCAGVKTILIPEQNAADVEQIDKEVREHCEIVLCGSIADVLDRALVGRAAKAGTEVRMKKTETVKKRPRPAGRAGLN